MRYGTETKREPADVVKRARAFFGPDGELGLPERPGGVDSVTFGTETGHVTIQVVPRDGHTDVTVTSREYDSWAERFIREIG
jgi:hypothetical protein